MDILLLREQKHLLYNLGHLAIASYVPITS